MCVTPWKYYRLIHFIFNCDTDSCFLVSVSYKKLLKATWRQELIELFDRKPSKTGGRYCICSCAFCEMYQEEWKRQYVKPIRLQPESNEYT